MREKEIEEKLRKAVEARGGLCWKFTSSVSGVPDRLVLLPGGKMAFVELKTKGKKPRPLQLRQMTRLNHLGFRTYVLDDEKEIGKLLQEIGGGAR